jgi:hypothetical protein
MLSVLRMLASLVLWVVVGYCAFGFLSTFEGPAMMPWMWRVIFVVVGLGAFVVGTRFVWPHPPEKERGRPK